MTLPISTSIPGLLRQAVRFLLPVECAACHTPLADDPIPYFCATCWNTIAPPSPARCARCDRPFVSPVATTYSPRHLCQSCHKRPPLLYQSLDALSLSSPSTRCDLPVQISRQSLAGRSVSPSHDRPASTTGGHRPDYPRPVARRAAARAGIQSIAAPRRQDRPASHHPGLWHGVDSDCPGTASDVTLPERAAEQSPRCLCGTTARIHRRQTHSID